jgi:MYXO-CTERM domain-containing protein
MLSSKARAECARPTDAGGAAGYAYGAAPVKTVDGARVRVHYTLEGTSAVRATPARPSGVPEDVARVQEVADDAMTRYEAKGFRAPLADNTGSCTEFGGDAKLDIYLVKFGGGDGQTVPESCKSAGKAKVCTSFLLVESKLGARYASAEEGIRTVVPHELFHAIQNAYDANLDGFFSEGSAQWATSSLYPELKDLSRFLPSFFKEPERSLDVASGGVTSGYLYGAAIWSVFLAERFGEDMPKKVLEAHAASGGPTLSVTDTVLADQGGLASAFGEFGAWNVGTGSRAGQGGYAQRASYPLVPVLSATDDAPIDGVLSGLSTRYYSISLSGRRRVALVGDSQRISVRFVPSVDGKANVSGAKVLPADFEGDGFLVVSTQNTKKSDAPYQITFQDAPADGPGPDAGAAADAGTAAPGAAPGDDGGCAVAHGPSPATGLALLAPALGLLALRRSRRRR